MKKTLKAMFIALMVFSLVFLASCGGKEEADASGDEVQLSANASNVNPVGVFPIVKEPITIRMAIQSNAQVTDFQDNEFTHWLEEKTGINLEMEVIPSTDMETKINLMFAAGEELPDMINVGKLSNDALYKYVLDGMIIPIDPYFDEYGEYFEDIMESNDGIRESMTAPDGHIYGIPKYNVTEHNMLKFGKMYLYQPWLDKLGLEVPKTTDELYEVLKAFKTMDPNGNGKADEIPLCGAAQGPGVDPIMALMCPFIPYHFDTYGLYNNNGTIEANYMKDEFREGLEYINKLVSEKLLDPVSFTQNQQQLKQLANRDEVILGGFIHAYTAVNVTNPQRLSEYTCLDLLDSGTGKGGFLKDPLLPKGPAVIITKDCENPEAAFRLADFLVSIEAGMRNRHGVPGRDWEYIENPEDFPNIEGLLGDTPKFRLINDPWGETGSTLWRSECAYYYDYDMVYRRGIEKGKFNADRYHADNSIEHFKPYVVGNIVPLNSLFFNEDELSEYSLIATSLHDHLRNQIAGFATGTRSLDEYDAFKKEMEGLGLEDYLRYIQAAYDRQFGDK